MAGLHTHDDGGTVHNEGQADATLGQFFAVGGVPFSKDRLGPYRAGEDGVVQLWVNGKPSTAFGSLRLADGQGLLFIPSYRESWGCLRRCSSSRTITWAWALEGWND